jgi:hypothetical protein
LRLFALTHSHSSTLSNHQLCSLNKMLRLTKQQAVQVTQLLLINQKKWSLRRATKAHQLVRGSANRTGLESLKIKFKTSLSSSELIRNGARKRSQISPAGQVFQKVKSTSGTGTKERNSTWSKSSWTLKWLEMNLAGIAAKSGESSWAMMMILNLTGTSATYLAWMLIRWP